VWVEPGNLVPLSVAVGIGVSGMRESSLERLLCLAAVD
jgi:hypothetical protein